MWISAVAAFSILLGGCSTIMSGTTQEMSFQSSPDDVMVALTTRVPGEGPEFEWRGNDRILGKTPLTVQIDKAEGRSVEFTKDGYKPVMMKLTTTLDSWFWGNIVFGGFIGSSTDSMSGASHEYSPSQYFVTLNPVTAISTESATLKSDREKAIEFIIRRYTSLLSDLSKGSGDDLVSLMGLLHIQSGKETDTHTKMRALSTVYTDAAIFAQHLTDLYLK